MIEQPDSLVDDLCRMTRRRFGTLAAGGLAALALPSGCAPRAGAAVGEGGLDLAYAGGDATPVSLAGVARSASEASIERAVRRVAEAATDFSWLGRGDTVLVKPACNSGNPYPATTDPVALRAVIRLLRERGAGRVIVADMSGVQFVRFGPDHLTGSTRALMQRAGMAQAAESAGAEVHAFEEAGWDGFFEERPAVSDHWEGPLWLPDVLRQVDHVVLMPRTAPHVLARSTLALKNAVGWWRHDARLEYHRDAGSLPEKTAEAGTAPTLQGKQRLVLTSGRKLFTTFGPDEGHAVEPETGIVFASTSVVAHDMVSLAWLLDNQRATPDELRQDDPATSAVKPELVNRVVTYWLGGTFAALGAERLGRDSLDSLWSNRVLRRVFEISGGVPRIDLEPAAGAPPSDLLERLRAELTLPA